MRVALVGSVSSSWYALEALIDGNVNVCGVLGVTETRGNRISDYHSLRSLAAHARLPFRDFVKISESGVRTFLQSKAPDVIWVIGLSQLVPDDILMLAPSGGVGYHPTMLPEGRGRAPIAWTILNGSRAAANLFHLTNEADADDIIAQREVPVYPDDYSEDLLLRTNLMLREVVLDLAPAIRTGKLSASPQDHSRATYHNKRRPADGLITWSETTEGIYRLVRAASRPYPGAFTWIEQEKIIVWRARPELELAPTNRCVRQPGHVLAKAANGELVVATGDGAVRLTQIEAQSGRPTLDLVSVGTQLHGDTAVAPERVLSVG